MPPSPPSPGDPRGLLGTERRLSDLEREAGDGTHRLVESLYDLWRAGGLRVVRDWGEPGAEGAPAPYSERAFFLPSDRLSLAGAASGPASVGGSRPLRVATWNVNSIRARLDLVKEWLTEVRPDVACLQETKVEDALFPRAEIEALGYHVAFSGQKTYNGVALLSRHPIEGVRFGFADGWDADNKRLVVARVAGLVVANAYVPQGSSVESDKFPYKLEFLDRLAAELAPLAGGAEGPLALLGDLNVAPDARDLMDPRGMAGKVSFHPEEHARLDKLRALGLADLHRKFHDDAGRYTWWDFRTRGFERGDGMRIDHIWASPALAERALSIAIDVENRQRPKPSDHAPVYADFRPA